ncbi:hypothetical protein BGZ83_001118 [Gryganskiella cystojenkinii]|nr:hypothetical protein BGZ83_001118 [Gryganskiella cystojenkinii]
MLRFLAGKAKPVDMNFNVWDLSLPEIYGTILAMFCQLGLVECLNITEGELLDFIIDVDKGYLATFYHSFYHAADVTAVLFNILSNMNASQYLSKPDMAALLLAGLCHDIGHPGLNNLFQVNAKTELVKQHGETSVLEKYSCSLAMELVAKHRLFRNIHKSSAAELPEGNRANEAFMKDAMIKAIMATDMSFHYDMLNNLNQLIEVTSTPSSTPSGSDAESSDSESESSPSSPTATTDKSLSATSPNAALNAMRACFDCPVRHSHNHRRQSSSSSTASNESDSSQASVSSSGTAQTSSSMDAAIRSPSDLTPELRQNLANCLLHAADISNAVKPWQLCKQWSDLVVEEFFRQGDIEKAQDLPISPNMDRNTSQQPQISLGFGDFVVLPYYESFVEFLPEAAPFLVSLTSNRVRWVELQKQLKEMAIAGSGSDNGSPISSEVSGLHIHPRSLQSLGKNVLAQEAVVSVLKREVSAALAGKEPVNLTGATATRTDRKSSPSSSSTHKSHLPSSTVAVESAPTSEPASASSEHVCCGMTASGYRQRRHGSLQLENSNQPSIRQEYGDGYVIVDNHPGLDHPKRSSMTRSDEGEVFIPLKPKLSISSSSSDPFPATVASAVVGESTTTVDASDASPLAKAVLDFHFGEIAPKEDRNRSLPAPPQRHTSAIVKKGTSKAVSTLARSSAPVISSNLRYDSSSLFGQAGRQVDRSGCGPLDVSAECFAPPTLTASPVMVSTATATGPAIPAPQQNQRGASEGGDSKDSNKSDTSVTVTKVDDDDGPLNVVVGQTSGKGATAAISAENNNIGAQVKDGAIGISAASSTSTPA